MRHLVPLLVLTLGLAACNNPDQASSGNPEHVGGRSDNTTPLTEPTPNNPTGVTPYGDTGTSAPVPTAGAAPGGDAVNIQGAGDAK